MAVSLEGSSITGFPGSGAQCRWLAVQHPGLPALRWVKALLAHLLRACTAGLRSAAAAQQARTGRSLHLAAPIQRLCWAGLAGCPLQRYAPWSDAVWQPGQVLGVQHMVEVRKAGVGLLQPAVQAMQGLGQKA